MRYSNSAVFVPKKKRETKIVNQARLPFLVPTARAAQKKMQNPKLEGLPLYKGCILWE